MVRCRLRRDAGIYTYNITGELMCTISFARRPFCLARMNWLEFLAVTFYPPRFKQVLQEAVSIKPAIGVLLYVSLR